MKILLVFSILSLAVVNVTAEITKETELGSKLAGVQVSYETISKDGVPALRNTYHGNTLITQVILLGKYEILNVRKRSGGSLRLEDGIGRIYHAKNTKKHAHINTLVGSDGEISYIKLYEVDIEKISSDWKPLNTYKSKNGVLTLVDK